jgi:hypothetical protein
MTYNYSGETVFGEVIDAVNGEPLAFAKIQMANNPNMVVSTDASGRFSFTVPRGEVGYTVNYLGYNAQYVNIDSPFRKVMLVPQAVEMVQLQNNVSTGLVFPSYSGATSYDYSLTSPMSVDMQALELSEVTMSKREQKKMMRAYERDTKIAESEEMGGYNEPVAEAVQKDLRMEFQINTPFTIPSDDADHRVAIAVYEMPASYEYHSVPKLDPSVYLVAQISGWEKLNLLNGESNLYFDGTFIGKSYVDVNSVKDTLSFSLGKDKKVIVERKRSEEKSKTRAIGNRTKYEVQWDFTIRNNGGSSIPFIMKDHFPVPVNDDIKVKKGDYTGAALDEKTGILTWKSVLAKGEIKNYSFNYSVEYSNSMPLYLE